MKLLVSTVIIGTFAAPNLILEMMTEEENPLDHAINNAIAMPQEKGLNDPFYDPCNEHGCSHFCHSSQGNLECSCPYGLTLDQLEGKNCEEAKPVTKWNIYRDGALPVLPNDGNGGGFNDPETQIINGLPRIWKNGVSHGVGSMKIHPVEQPTTMARELSGFNSPHDYCLKAKYEKTTWATQGTSPHKIYMTNCNDHPSCDKDCAQGGYWGAGLDVKQKWIPGAIEGTGQLMSMINDENDMLREEYEVGSAGKPYPHISSYEALCIAPNTLLNDFNTGQTGESWGQVWVDTIAAEPVGLQDCFLPDNTPNPYTEFRYEDGKLRPLKNEKLCINWHLGYEHPVTVEFCGKDLFGIQMYPESYNSIL